MDAKSLMFSAITSQFPWGNAEKIPESADQQTIEDIYAMSLKQDMAHIVAAPLERLAEGEAKSAFKKQKMLAIFRREQINFEENKIFALFDENGIDYIPLKGSVIKKYYPEEWMRTSSDTDILIRLEDSDKAISLLESKLGYKYEGKSTKDFQLFSQNGVHIELHYSPENGNSNTDKVLSRIWDYSVKVENTNRYDLTPEFLMFYTIAHALYHFLGGGCGIKPFLDLWVLNHQMEYNADELNRLLKESQSKRFFDEFTSLSKVWLEGGQHTSLTKSMEDYIFDGGVYGNRENLGKAKMHREGGRLKYLLNRIFKPKKELMLQYPALEKRPYLLPYYQVKRWFNLLDRKRRSDVTSELQGGLKKDDTENLFKQLGI